MTEYKMSIFKYGGYDIVAGLLLEHGGKRAG